MKLVYVHCWGDEAASGIDTIPFEYESKEKFVFDILEAFPTGTDYRYIKIFGDIYLYEHDLSNLEHSVYTLEDWFNKRKQKVW